MAAARCRGRARTIRATRGHQLSGRNASVAPVHNNQRDGIHRQAIPRGRVAYEPNSLGGGSPAQAGPHGFVSFPEPMHEDKLRGKPEKFADHYTQATLFWNSQSPPEKAHIIAAFSFELTRVQTNAVRARVLSMLANVDDTLVAGIADRLGMDLPDPMPRALEHPAAPEVESSPALSLLARPGDGSIRTRHVAVIVSPGVIGKSLIAVYQALADAGATPRFVGAKLGVVPTTGPTISVEVSMTAAPAVLFDALVLPDGDDLTTLAADAHVMDLSETSTGMASRSSLLAHRRDYWRRPASPWSFRPVERIRVW